MYYLFLVSFMTQPICQGGQVNHQLLRIWMETIMTWSRYYTDICLEWLKNNRIPVKIEGVRLMIRKRHILNSCSTINFYHYHYAKQLSLHEHECNNHNKKKRSICIKHTRWNCTLHVSFWWRKLASLHVIYHSLLQRWSLCQILHYLHNPYLHWWKQFTRK